MKGLAGRSCQGLRCCGARHKQMTYLVSMTSGGVVPSCSRDAVDPLHLIPGESNDRLAQ